MARFRYLNLNPDGEKVGDCVTRAIALAMDMDYFDVSEDLVLSARQLNCDKLYVCYYSNLLNNIYDLEPVECEGYTVNEFADLHPYGSYIIRMDSHLSCLIDGCVYDIWDCRNEILTHAWRVD